MDIMIRRIRILMSFVVVCIGTAAGFPDSPDSASTSRVHETAASHGIVFPGETDRMIAMGIGLVLIGGLVLFLNGMRKRADAAK